MDKEYEHKYNQLSDTHCWFVARRNLVLALIKHYRISSEQNILEIGCGWGAQLNDLNASGYLNTWGFDISEEAVAHCQSQGMKNILKMDVTNMQYDDSSFDLVIASDVLEHVEDEQQALKEIHRVLKKGGIFIILVPAFNFLWSDHDVVNLHYRRYSKTSLYNSLEKGRFLINKSSYWNASLFFPVLVMRFLKKIVSFIRPSAPKDSFHSLNPVLNKLLLGVLKTENKIILDFFNLPFGVSVFSVAKK